MTNKKAAVMIMAISVVLGVVRLAYSATAQTQTKVYGFSQTESDYTVSFVEGSTEEIVVKGKIVEEGPGSASEMAEMIDKGRKQETIISQGTEQDSCDLTFVSVELIDTDVYSFNFECKFSKGSFDLDIPIRLVLSGLPSEVESRVNVKSPPIFLPQLANQDSNGEEEKKDDVAVEKKDDIAVEKKDDVAVEKKEEKGGEITVETKRPFLDGSDGGCSLFPQASVNPTLFLLLVLAILPLAHRRAKK